MRKRKIVLKQCLDVGQARTYEVVSLTNSIEFNIGQILTEQEVDALCLGDAWTVSIRAM